MPFGRTRFFAGTALILAVIAGVVYYLMKDSDAEKNSTAGSITQEARRATTRENLERTPSLPAQSTPPESAGTQAFSEARPPAANDGAGAAQGGEQGDPTTMQKVSEVSRRASPAVQESAKGPSERTSPKEIRAPSASPGQDTSDTAARHEDGFAIQFGAYSRMEAAERTQQILKGHGVEAKVLEYGGIYRVRVGPFKTRQQAEEAATRLQKDSGLAYLITTQ